MKLTVVVYQDYDHDSRKEFTIEGHPELLNKILTGIVISDIVGILSEQAEDKE